MGKKRPAAMRPLAFVQECLMQCARYSNNRLPSRSPAYPPGSRQQGKKQRQKKRFPLRERGYSCSYEQDDKKPQGSALTPPHPLDQEPPEAAGAIQLLPALRPASRPPHRPPRMGARAKAVKIQEKAEILPAPSPDERGGGRVRHRDRREQQHRGQGHPENDPLEAGDKP